MRRIFVVSIKGYGKVQLACLIALVALVALLAWSNDGKGHNEIAFCESQNFTQILHKEHLILT